MTTARWKALLGMLLGGAVLAAVALTQDVLRPASEALSAWDALSMLLLLAQPLGIPVIVVALELHGAITARTAGAVLGVVSLPLCALALAIPPVALLAGPALLLSLLYLSQGKGNLTDRPEVRSALDAYGRRHSEGSRTARVWLSMAPGFLQVVGWALVAAVLAFTFALPMSMGPLGGILLGMVSGVVGAAVLVVLLLGAALASPLFGRAERRAMSRLLRNDAGSTHVTVLVALALIDAVLVASVGVLVVVTLAVSAFPGLGSGVALLSPGAIGLLLMYRIALSGVGQRSERSVLHAAPAAFSQMMNHITGYAFVTTIYVGIVSATLFVVGMLTGMAVLEGLPGLPFVLTLVGVSGAALGRPLLFLALLRHALADLGQEDGVPADVAKPSAA